jgi:5'-3' exonuclease
MEFVKLVLHALGIKIIEAPYEADHQITKMKNEGFIQCVFSTDYDYVDYAVPLVKTFGHDGRG